MRDNLRLNYTKWVAKVNCLFDIRLIFSMNMVVALSFVSNKYVKEILIPMRQ